MPAAMLADKETSAEIQSRHVFGGALTIETCGPVKELLARGVPPADSFRRQHHSASRPWQRPMSPPRRT